MRFPIENYCVREHSTIKDTMMNIDKNLTSASLVVDDNMKLLGMITDGDIRRALLKGYDLNSIISEIYFKNFKSVTSLVSKNKARKIMLEYKIRQLPVLNKEGKVVDMYFLDDIISFDEKENYVIIMAGGKGTRLRPLTEDTPKPMLKLGDKPMLEHIIMNFKEYGYKNFLLSINYKGEIIEEYFKDGKKLGVNIDYIREEEPLGTAGAISLVREKLNDDFIVINGDILTGIDFDDLLNQHIKGQNCITPAVREYEMQIPYGVVVEESYKIKAIEEKPEYVFNILSGVYVLSPKTLEYIPQNEFYNMPDLINEMSKKFDCGTYKIQSYWMDVGVHENYNRANEDIYKFF